MNSTIREDHLLVRKFEDQNKWMIHFSTPISDIIEFNDEVNIIFKLYKENYRDNLDSIIESLYDTTRPAVYNKTAFPKTVELSCQTGTDTACRSVDCIVHKLNVSYSEDGNFIQVHIYAKGNGKFL